MIIYKRFLAHLIHIGAIMLVAAVPLLNLSCEKGDFHKTNTSKKTLTEIKNEKHFNHIIESSNNRLLLFEFYADWCAPCKDLEPILEEIAAKHKNEVEIYKINYDSNPKLSVLFKVAGLPYVAFVKNRVILHSILGLHPKESYVNAVKSYSKHSS